jgi:hypothetical protein
MMTFRFSSDARTWFKGLLPLSALLALPLAGCAVADDEAAEDVGPPGNHEVIEEFVLHVQPRLHLATLTRVVPQAAAGLGPPGLMPQAETSVNLCQDGTPGTSNPLLCGLPAGTQTVELVTTQSSINTDAGCPSGYTTNSFCASVILNSFWNRSLPFTYVQVTAITSDSGVAMSGHSAINSDATAYGLSNSLGLWAYNSPSATGAFLGQAPYNTATREWVFANPDNADTNIQLRVVAATTFSSYPGFETLLHPYINACTGGTQLATSVTESTQTLPFPFTLYGTTYDGTTNPQRVSFSKVGVMTLGSTADTLVTGNVKLPSCATTPCASAPKPAIFPFWDNLTYTTKGMCYASGGTAPNRTFAVSWNAMNFGNGTPASDRPASMTFGAVLHEGTNDIDFVYDSMTGPSSRSKGGKATVGVQNETATVATTTFDDAAYTTNTSKTLVPSP